MNSGINKLLLKNLACGYHFDDCLQSNINIEIKEGTLVTLIGRNGSGKSTFLKTIAGFLLPLEGEVLLNNKNLYSLPIKERAMKMAVVFTERPQLANMRVFDLVATGRIPYTGFWDKKSNEDIQIINESLEQCGILNLSQKFTDSVSDGEFQKAMMAKALAQNTNVILLDEPTAFLDYPSKVELIKLLVKMVREQGKIIIVSSHDIELMLRNSDLAIYLRKGESYIMDTPQNLVDSQALKDLIDNNFFI